MKDDVWVRVGAGAVVARLRSWTASTRAGSVWRTCQPDSRERRGGSDAEHRGLWRRGGGARFHSLEAIATATGGCSHLLSTPSANSDIAKGCLQAGAEGAISSSPTSPSAFAQAGLAARITGPSERARGGASRTRPLGCVGGSHPHPPEQAAGPGGDRQCRQFLQESGADPGGLRGRCRLRIPDVPNYPAPAGTKVAAGWLIDRAGWKGHDQGHTWGATVRRWFSSTTAGHQGAGRASPCREDIQADIRRSFGVDLEREVNVLPALIRIQRKAAPGAVALRRWLGVFHT